MQNPLAVRKVPELFFSLAVPAMLSQFITLGYNIVDRAYIGHMDDGAAAMTAVGLCMPVFLLILAVTTLFGRGGAPLSGIRLGARDKEGADRLISCSTSLLIASSLGITLGVLLFSEPLLLLFGASRATLPYAREYLCLCSLGTPFTMISLGLNSFINSQGYTKVGMMTPLIGGLVNIVLDPILIFVLDMGIRGAAIATVIAQFCAFLWVLRFFRGPLAQSHVRRHMLALRWSELAPILLTGASPSFMVATEGLLLMAFNTQLARFGGDSAVGSMAILAALFQLQLLPMIGIYQGAQPIVSFNYGTGDLARVREAIWTAGKALLGYSVFTAGMLTAFPEFFVGLFTPDGELADTAVPLLRLYICGTFFLGFTVVSQDTYNALGDGKLSLFFAIFRKLILLIPLIYLLPTCMDDKIRAVILAEPMSDIAASLSSAVYFAYYFKKKLSDKKTEQ